MQTQTRNRQQTPEGGHQFADIEQVRQHSEKAMKLAKSMRRTRQKAKTGQVICHHLRMMLAEELPPVGGRRLRLAEPVQLKDERDSPQIPLI